MDHPYDAQKHLFAKFYALVIFLSGSVILSLVLMPGLYGISGLEELFTTLDQTSEKLGIALRGTAFIPFIQLSLSEPVLWLISLVVAAPTLAAFILTAWYFGRSGLRVWIARLLPWRNGVSVKDGLGIWTALTLSLTCFLLGQFTLASTLGLGPTFVWGYDFTAPLFVWLLVSSLFLDQGGLLEELGWRGFAAPILQCQMTSPLKAAVTIGFFWALWHLPLSFHGFDSVPIFLLQQAMFFTSTIALSVIIQYVSNRLGGSVLAAMAIHGATNDSIGLGGTGYDFTDPTTILVRNVPTIVVGISVVLFVGRGLAFGEHNDRKA